MSRFVINDPPPATLGRCFTPRSLNAAFGPYARLDVERRDPDRVVGVAIWCVAAAVIALALAGVLR